MLCETQGWGIMYYVLMYYGNNVKGYDVCNWLSGGWFPMEYAFMQRENANAYGAE